MLTWSEILFCEVPILLLLIFLLNCLPFFFFFFTLKSLYSVDTGPSLDKWNAKVPHSRACRLGVLMVSFDEKCLILLSPVYQFCPVRLAAFCVLFRKYCLLQVHEVLSSTFVATRILRQDPSF